MKLKFKKEKTTFMKSHFEEFAQKMEDHNLPKIVIKTFEYYYNKLISGETGLLSDNDILPIKDGELIEAEGLDNDIAANDDLLSQAVMIKLNGGLGTSMGLPHCKSLLEVKDGMSFLDIILNQSRHSNVGLVLMNSFSTHEDTTDKIKKSKNINNKPICFVQHKFPKVMKNDFSPAKYNENPKLEWNPPGHGDLYTALVTSGTLDTLLELGKNYALISNSDNLGAVMDKKILGYFAKNKFPFMMEVTHRNELDVKGGHLARLKEGPLTLREIAQCPEDEINSFQNINLYKYFNTNNIWVHLPSLKKIVEKEQIMPLPLIRNPKKLNPIIESSPDVFQIETAVGSALTIFQGAAAIIVKRDRYHPVKKCNQLLGIWSDSYVYTDKHRIVINPKRSVGHLLIKLDEKYYKRIDQLKKRFPYGPPSLVDCKSFTVKGDVLFEENLVAKGDVTIENLSSDQMIVKKGTVLTG